MKWKLPLLLLIFVFGAQVLYSGPTDSTLSPSDTVLAEANKPAIIEATPTRPLAGLPEQNAQGQPISGIPAIDSLPLDDWALPTPPLPYGRTLALGLLLPGGAQFSSGHIVRGSFLAGLEVLLTGLALQAYYSEIPKRNGEITKALDSAYSVFNSVKPDETLSESQFKLAGEQIGYARDRASLSLRQADLANSQLAWAIGLHGYGFLDGLEIVSKSHGVRDTVRSVRKAFLYGLFIPGGGQLYNHRYGKFGMLYMAFGASALSAWSRQNVVEHLNMAVAAARVEASLGGSKTRLDDLIKDRTQFRKRRNQYYWGIALFYIYSVMDGMVDAALADFDQPSRYALELGDTPLSLRIAVNF